MKRFSSAALTAFCAFLCKGAPSSAFSPNAVLTAPSTRPAQQVLASSRLKEQPTDCKSESSSSTTDVEGPWATNALLFSSLTDGILPNPAARSFLRYSLASSLLREHILDKEDGLKSSVKFSPCNGPNVDALNNLEHVDEILAKGLEILQSNNLSDTREMDDWSKETIDHILLSNKKNNNPLNIRIIYIPTAMYALNPQSSNTPGKQRQRARADGKKRRTQLLQLVEELIFPSDGTDNDAGENGEVNLLGITLDLDDGSLKQPVGSDDLSLFPENDEVALSTWKPHIIYLEGGNTFWLQHCIEKRNYATLIKTACTGDSGSIYMGKSAGAIVAGRNVATATWKGWDDPSVVPGRETYDQWQSCQGFGFVGENSFFPHMNDDWESLVEEKKNSIDFGNNVHCLREEDVCCVVGRKKEFSIQSGPAPQ